MKGYLTALTAMLLAVLLPLWLLLIEGSRISGMKARAEMVMDTGMAISVAVEALRILIEKDRQNQ